ncbi:MAG: glycine--tRNA ligase subunit beta, partial [Cyanobacteria bacterium J06641_5]
MATYLLEVGTEELPAEFIDGAVAQWRARVGQSLAEAFLAPAAIEIFGTPRRLALLLQGLPAKQPDREEEIKGPPAKAAFKDGAPTKAAEGFARKQEVPIEALEVRETNKGPFVFIQKQITGRPAAEILQELVPGWITSLEGKRFMRWGDGDLRFPRPIRWLVSLLDAEVLPLEFVNGSETIRSDRTSRGHRVLHPGSVEIPQAQDYLEIMAQASVQADITARREAIAASVQAAAKERGGWVSLDEDLLAEVTNLVEYPSVVVGKFDTEFLELPPEVIAMEMIDHQRYFPVWADESQNQLLPYFATIANGDPSKGEVIAAGNERVIRARLADGQFFFKADRAEPLESFLPKLEPVTFQEKLGSVRAKIDRICQTSAWVAEQLQVSATEKEQVARAALLCKADLASQMVYEFPELQGVMGEKYARA